MPSSIDLQLFAPRTPAACVIGSFSDGQPIPMQKTEQGYFQTSIELEDGVYTYHFRVQPVGDSSNSDGWIEINDPYATELDGETGQGILRIKEGDRILDTYVWQHDDTLLPSNDELVIYELLIPDFYVGNSQSSQGQYQQVIDKLDYLVELGINAIELMPVNATPGDYNWGYTPSYFFAPNPAYGSTEELKHLIDHCHARGIRVILDQLYNHSSEESPLFHLDRTYWYYGDRHHPERPQDYWGPEFNYEYHDNGLDLKPAWTFMGDVVRFWVQNYHIDGIRFDALKEIDNLDFMTWLTQEAKQAAGEKPFYCIGEYIPDSPDVVQPKGAMDACWRDSYYYALVEHLRCETFDLSRLKEAIDPTYQGYPGQSSRVIQYLTSHDHARLMADLQEHGLNESTALQRAKLGAVVLMTSVGIPMLLMGEEFGEIRNMAPNEPSPLNWSLMQGDRSSLWALYQTLTTLRKTNPAFHTANVDFIHDNPDQKILAYKRWHEDGSQVIVIANFSDQSIPNYHLSEVPSDQPWYDYFTRYEIPICDGLLTLDIAPNTAYIWINR